MDLNIGERLVPGWDSPNVIEHPQSHPVYGLYKPSPVMVGFSHRFTPNSSRFHQVIFLKPLFMKLELPQFNHQNKLQLPFVSLIFLKQFSFPKIFPMFYPVSKKKPLGN